MSNNSSDSVEQYLMEKPVLEDHDETDELCQLANIKKLVKALYNLQEGEKKKDRENPEKFKQTVNDLTNKWKEDSDKGFEVYNQVQQYINQINKYFKLPLQSFHESSGFNNDYVENLLREEQGGDNIEKEVNDFIKQEQQQQEEQEYEEEKINNKQYIQNKESYKVFRGKIQQELEKVEKYLYMSLASSQISYKDIKYIILCMTSSHPRLEKFQEFLQNYKQILEKNEILSPYFDFVMQTEQKIKYLEKKLTFTQQTLNTLQYDIDTTLDNSTQILTKKQLKKLLKQNNIHEAQHTIEDSISENKESTKQQRLKLVRIRKILYQENLIDFCGKNGFLTVNFEEKMKEVQGFDKLEQESETLIYRMGLRIQQIDMNIKKIKEFVEDFIEENVDQEQKEEHHRKRKMIKSVFVKLFRLSDKKDKKKDSTDYQIRKTQ